MNIHVYLDHNIIDDLSKGDCSLKPSDQVIWIYSHENLREIRRSGNEERFLGVLENIKARKLELLLDENFRMTGTAQFHEYQAPQQVYETYLEAVTDHEIDDETNLELMARFFGSDNKDKILSHPESFEENIRSLLEPYGLFTDETRQKVAKVRNNLENLVSGPMQEVEELEKVREAFGTDNGRAGNLAHRDNPIEEIWNVIKKTAPHITADQFFGFDPIDKQGYEEWPIYLGIVGCHTMLNFLGFRPDKGLSKAQDLPSILSDASHIGHAAYCQALLSRDRKLLAKASAIYRFKGIGTHMLSYERNGG